MTRPLSRFPRPPSPDDELCREIGWNGIRLMPPAAWNPLVVGKFYLMLGENGDPVCEVRWQPGAGSSRKGASLQQLARKLNRSKRISVVKIPLPQILDVLARTWNAEVFHWQDDLRQGLGLLLACRHCGGAILIRFFQGSDGHHFRPLIPLLQTFRDHADNGRRLWALYDIRAWLPTSLRLERFRFESGRFELAFADRGFDLRLLRWAPAEVLLQSGGLTGFIETARFCPPPGESSRLLTGDAMVQWCEPSGGAWAVRLKRWLRLQPEKRWVRCWHQPLHNRILGVVAEGPHLPATAVLETICQGYETI